MQGLLQDSTILFDAGLLPFVSASGLSPNSFNGTIMSLWGANFDVDGNATLGLDLRLELAPSVVPVPAAAWLFGSGLLGLVAVARRKIIL